jgi:hypothetical protein
VRALADGFCFAHSPRLAEKRKAAHAAGGRHSATRSRMARKVAQGPLSQVQAVLLQTIAGVLRQQVDPRQATAVAALSSALVRVYELNEQEAALADALERLEALERTRWGRGVV